MAMGKQQLPALHVLTLLHITRTVLLLRLTPPLLPPTLTRQQNRRGKLMALTQHDEVSRNSFVRFSSIQVAPKFFTLILANTTNNTKLAKVVLLQFVT